MEKFDKAYLENVVPKFKSIKEFEQEISSMKPGRKRNEKIILWIREGYLFKYEDIKKFLKYLGE